MPTRVCFLLCSVIPTIMLQLCVLSSKIGDNDKITSLVGQPHVEFQQFAGYIPVNDEQTKERAMFYYFVEAETNPLSKPLVLWFAGGPGCSSVGVGAFVEHGPFRPNGNGGLVKNNYSWNKVANMLYLESPAGVGFSYSTNKSFYAFIDDEITARDNFQFLQNWLERFPEYKNRNLFITGESYAGHYVPQLANLVLNSNLKSNLKGILIGSPVLEFNTDLNSKAEYLWSHGLISDSTYDLLNKVCNYSEIRRQSIKGQLSPACFQVNSQADKEMRIGDYINPLDISYDVCSSSNTSQTTGQTMMGEKTEKQDGKLDECVEEAIVKYLNRKDVQRALHAKLIGVEKWATCSQVVNYDLQDLEVPILPLLNTLVKSGIGVSIYSGDQDPILPFTGTRIDVSRLASGLGLNTTVAYQAWLQDRKVGGWTQAYGRELSFALIRGAGHVAPYTQPERTLLVFSKFLEGKPLPLVH